MKTKVTTHHTAFLPLGTADYASRVLLVETKEGADINTIAEHAFHDTNAPGAKPVELSREGRCYSTSCGDILEINGQFVMVVGIGFLPITSREFTRLLSRQHTAHSNGERFEMDWDGQKLLKEWRAANTTNGAPSVAKAVAVPSIKTAPVPAL